MPKQTTTIGLIAVLVIAVVCMPSLALAQCSGGYNCDCQQCQQSGYSYYCSSNQECYSWEVECGAECSAPCENVVGCSGCNQGYNCTCPQCQAQGYSYYCITANECYDSYATCSVSCQYTADCQPTTACAPRSTCSNTALCPVSNSTCCVDSDGAQFCAPYTNAVCCEYNRMTCPFNTTCDPPSGRCMPPPPKPSSNCLECQKIVAFIEQKGCGECSVAFPALSWLCDLISEMGLCTYITSHMLPPLNMCEIVGFCGNAGCTCGYCRPSLYGQWCLSLPNVCPPSAGSAAALVDRPSVDVSRKVARRKLSDLAERMTKHQQMILNSTDYCLDGWCDENHNGCCLTCA